MAKEGSVAPKERVNVTFKPATGNAQEDVELPLKTMVLGDFTLRADDRKLEDRKPINVDKNNFNEVLEKQELKLDLNVKNQLAEEDSDTSDDLSVSLDFKSIRDFDPASVVEQVPELNQLMQLRDALVALKGPLGNTPAFRSAIEEVLANTEARDKVLSELGLEAEK